MSYEYGSVFAILTGSYQPRETLWISLLKAASFPAMPWAYSLTAFADMRHLARLVNYINALIRRLSGVLW